jgi:UDP-N-acetylmuramoyl-tripeptide--D-alanyl-D-alanine ligase
MKLILKKILQYYLKYLTKFVLTIHRPTIIAIAGSTNKTFIKDEISKILRKEGINTRSNPKSFNTEIGLPLSILNLPSGYNSYKNWLPIIMKATSQIFKSNFPRFLVLELGVSDPKDMKYLLSIIKPRIAIITDLTQRYLESFDDMDELAGEYEHLVKKIKPYGLLVLNYDNPRIKNMANISKITTKYFGLSDGAHWQAIEVKKEDRGQVIKVNYNDIVNQYTINRFGRHHVYSLLVGLIIKDYVKKEKKI